MERFVYVNGEFWDRVSNTPEEIARSLGTKKYKVTPHCAAISGKCERVDLEVDDETKIPIGEH